MIIRRVLVENAGPFLNEWEVEFPEGVVAVVGEYEESEVRSNRAGKSWLAVDGLLYALFGRFRGRTDDFVHRAVRGVERGFVEYELENSEGTRFVVRRGRDGSGTPIREVDGAPIKEAGLEELVAGEILGLSYDELVMTNVFVQGRMHQFMEMTPAEKRRVVSPWFRTDRWVPRADLAGRRLRAAQAALRVLDVTEENARREVERNEDRVAGIPAIELSLETARGVVADVLEERAAVLAEIESNAGRQKERERKEAALRDALTSARLEIEEAEDLLESTSRRRSAAWTAVEEARGRADRIKAFEREAEARDELSESVTTLRGELANLRNVRDEDERVRESLLERYTALTEDKTGICPILMTFCDRVVRDEALVEGVKRDGLRRRRAISRSERAISEIDWKLGLTRSELAGAEEAARTAARFREGVSVAQAEHEVEVAGRAKSDAESAVGRAKRGGTPTGRALRDARKALEALPEASSDGPTRRLAEISGEREAAERRRDALESDLAAARALVAEDERNLRYLEEVGGKKAEARAEVERLAWAAYAFGAAGIPSRELENAFGVAEDSMNSVLTDLEAPTRLRFSPSRELKDWEPACLACGESFEKGERRHVCRECGVPRRRRRRDELRLEVLDGEHASSFELDSGGGKVLLSLGVRFGLTPLPASTRRVRCESAVIDEPDGALDPPNRAALHALLRNRLPALGIRQALLITHADVRDEFDNVVVVRRWPDEDRSGFWRG